MPEPVPRQSDVLVIGAGPAGAATAIRAARAGFRTTLVDRARFPRDKACAEYMSPETVRQLALLGALERLERLGGVRLAGTTVTGPHGSRLTGLFARAPCPPFRPTGLSLPRRDLDHALVEVAREAGVRVLEEWTHVDLVHDHAAVAGAALRGPDGAVAVHRARITVGADGLRSRVARGLGGQRTGRPARLAFAAHVAGVDGLTDRAELHVGPRGYVGLNPLRGGRANVSLVVPAGDAAGARGGAERYFVQRLETFPGVRGRIAGPVVRRVLVTGPFAARARRVVADGALLVGDAADFFDPFTGEGICAALRGAALATEAMAGALNRPGLVRARDLAPYLGARRRAFAGKWAVERLVGWGMLAPALFDRAVARLERRGRGHTFIGVTGEFVPAREVLNPRFLAGMLW